jgi:hypothetical protein
MHGRHPEVEVLETSFLYLFSHFFPIPHFQAFSLASSISFVLLVELEADLIHLSVACRLRLSP